MQKRIPAITITIETATVSNKIPVARETMGMKTAITERLLMNITIRMAAGGHQK